MNERDKRQLEYYHNMGKLSLEIFYNDKRFSILQRIKFFLLKFKGVSFIEVN